MATNAFEAIRTMLAQYGLESLAPQVQKIMTDGLTDSASIMFALRQTPEYQARFPAMAALNQKGRGFSEADYINYERNAAQQEQQYGFPKGFLTDPHRIQGMLEADVSASELTDRARINAAVSLQAPQETKDALQRLYGLDQGGVAAFYFDPENSVPYLEKQAASATLAGAAARNAIDITRQMAEGLVEQGVSEAQAAQGFQQVSALGGLSTGQGETATQDEIVRATFGDQAATNKVERVQKTRTGQFADAGGAAASQSGVSGLGSSGGR